MAVFVYKDARVEINAVDHSDHVQEAGVQMESAEREKTAMGAAGTSALSGLRTDGFTFTLHQDFAASKVDATLWPLFDGGTEFVVKVRPTTAAISATNPEYSGTCILLAYPPLDGAVGSLAQTQISLRVNGKISRAVA